VLVKVWLNFSPTIRRGEDVLLTRFIDDQIGGISDLCVSRADTGAICASGVIGINGVANVAGLSGNIGAGLLRNRRDRL
jgi:hypothetical protein